DGRLVADLDLRLVDLGGWIGIRARLLVQQQRVAANEGLRVLRARVDLHQPAVGGPSAILGDRLGDDVGAGVGCHVDGLAAGVLVLALAGERDAQHIALGTRLHQIDGGVLHGDLRAQVAVYPFHGRVAVGDGALGDQVVDVGGPVLHRRVAATGTALDDDLDHGRVQRVGGVDGCGAAFDVVHEAVLVADDQGPLELAHVLGVDPEIGLQRDLDLDTLGDVDERPTRPDRAVQRG